MCIKVEITWRTEGLQIAKYCRARRERSQGQEAGLREVGERARWKVADGINSAEPLVSKKKKKVSSSLNLEQTLWLKWKYTDMSVSLLPGIRKPKYIYTVLKKLIFCPLFVMLAGRGSLLIGVTQIFISKGSEPRLCGVLSMPCWLLTWPWHYEEVCRRITFLFLLCYSTSPSL